MVPASSRGVRLNHPRTGKRLNLPLLRANKNLPVKKARRRPGTVAKREVAAYMGASVRKSEEENMLREGGKKATDLLINKAAFQRLVREVFNCFKSDCRITREALVALHTAAEDHLVGVFQDANLVRQRARKETLTQQDMRVAMMIRRERVGSVMNQGNNTRGPFASEGKNWTRKDGVPPMH